MQRSEQHAKQPVAPPAAQPPVAPATPPAAEVPVPPAPVEVTERSTNIVAGPGGVMTDEVGVVTGDLTLCTRLEKDRTAVVHVQYLGAEEWYVVTGARTPLACAADLDAVHAIAVALLNRPEG